MTQSEGKKKIIVQDKKENVTNILRFFQLFFFLLSLYININHIGFRVRKCYFVRKKLLFKNKQEKKKIIVILPDIERHGGVTYYFHPRKYRFLSQSGIFFFFT